MMILPLFLLFAVLSLLFVAAEVIPLNPNATIHSDVQIILHNPTKRTVNIHLTSSRRCITPVFVVRLSGTSLYLMDLNSSEGNMGDYEYSYPELDQGVHFISILVLYCNEIKAEINENNCVESVHDGANILNLPYRFEAGESIKRHSRTRWIHPPWAPHNEPIRYQNHSCGNEKYCESNDEDLILSSLYRFVGDSPVEDDLDGVIALLGNIKPIVINVCFVGSTQSHTAKLQHPGDWLSLDLLGNVRFHFVKSSGPSEFSVAEVDKKGCSYVVLGYGEEAFQGHNTPNVSDFLTEMNVVLKSVAAPAYSGPIQFFVRGMHYSGLGQHVTSCPPTDFRTPHFVDLVNDHLKKEAELLQVEYIDLTHISGPVWDKSSDWVHYSSRVYEAEVQHIIHSLFRHSVKHRRPPRVDPGLTIYPENSVLRMQADRTVYLYRAKQLHAFPDGHTFMAMGFDFGQVIVVPESLNQYFGGSSMGESLPHV